MFGKISIYEIMFRTYCHTAKLCKMCLPKQLLLSRLLFVLAVVARCSVGFHLLTCVLTKV